MNLINHKINLNIHYFIILKFFYPLFMVFSDNRLNALSFFNIKKNFLYFLHPEVIYFIKKTIVEKIIFIIFNIIIAKKVVIIKVENVFIIKIITFIIKKKIIIIPILILIIPLIHFVISIFLDAIINIIIFIEFIEIIFNFNEFK